MKKSLISVIILLCIIGCDTNDKKQNEDTNNSKEYNIIQEEIEGRGFNINLENGTKDNVFVNFYSDSLNYQFFSISFEYKNDTTNKMIVTIDFERYEYSLDEENNGTLEDAFSEIGYSKSELLEFSDWYYNQNK